MRNQKCWLIGSVLTAVLFVCGLFAPSAKAEDFSNVFLYVTEPALHRVDIVNLVDGSLLSPLDLGTGSFPVDVASSTDGRVVYISDYTGQVYVFNTATHAIENTITGTGHIIQLVLSPDGLKLYGLDQDNDVIRVIDTQSLAVVQTINPMSGHIWNMDVSPDGQKLYVTNDGTGGNIFVIDTATNTLIATITPSGTGPVSGAGITIRPQGDQAVVCDLTGQAAFLLDLTSHAYAAITGLNPASGHRPQFVTVNPAGTKAYITDTSGGSNTLLVVDLAARRLSGSVTVSQQPANFAFSPAGSRLYVANFIGGVVSTIDTVTDANLGNALTPGAGVYGVAVVDLSSPTGSVQINDGAQRTASPRVTPKSNQ